MEPANDWLLTCWMVVLDFFGGCEFLRNTIPGGKKCATVFWINKKQVKLWFGESQFAEHLLFRGDFFQVPAWSVFHGIAKGRLQAPLDPVFKQPISFRGCSNNLKASVSGQWLHETYIRNDGMTLLGTMSYPRKTTASSHDRFGGNSAKVST